MIHLPTPSPQPQVEVLARAIAAINTAEFVPLALDYLRTAIAFHGCFLTLLEGKRPPLHIYDNVNAQRRADVIDAWLDGAYRLDPFYVAYTEDRPCIAARLRDVAPDRFPQSSYFREYYGGIRLHDEAGVLIDVPGGQHLFYSLGRLIGEPRFSRRDIDAANRILPVFAAINRRHFARADALPAQDAPNAPAITAIAPDDIDNAMDAFGTGLLTERESQIAILILKGHSSKSIAHRIGVSPGTVKIHRRNFYRKLNISSQSELFSLFLETLGQAA
ncbi:helix-turn-helix transcriptional regulator [Rhodobacteraceae bacterium KMM 6894]|nr:helix-turn-helix transcriptional regulator [Rhodobacteraceae bacterium KMM 6894]